MTEFPYFIAVGIIALHVCLVALIIIYVCRKYRCCACSCFISCCAEGVTSPSQPDTVSSINTLRHPDDTARTPGTLLTGIDIVTAMESSDPGLQHINRFLGRTYFSNDNNNENESDLGMLHIRRALGLVQQSETPRRLSNSNSAQGNVTPLTNRSTESLESTANRFVVPVPYNRAARDLDRANSNPTTSRSAGEVRETRLSEQTNDNSSSDLSDQLPTYQEAITLLAKQESEIHDIPPSYEDVINDDFENTWNSQ